jgi:hypothetical protein
VKSFESILTKQGYLDFMEQTFEVITA